MIFYNMYSKNTILSLFCFIWLLCGFCVLGCNSQGSTAKNKVEVNDTATNSVNEPDNNLSSTNEWYKRFEGTIGNLQVVVNLSLFDTRLAGNYYYVKRGEFIDIDGVQLSLVSVEHLIQIKKMAGRPQDIEDIKALLIISKDEK